MNEYPVGYETMQTYEVQHCMNGGNCLQRPTRLAVYTTQILAEKIELGLDVTHNRMNPSSRNDHCVAFPQINLNDFVDHVTQPCMSLYLAPGPTFIGSKVCGGRTYKEERLG